MIQTVPAKSLGDKTISTKLPREEFTRFQYYCKSNDETINSALRRLVLSEIDNPKPSMIAGKSVFEYNKKKDNFGWKVVLDDGTVFDISDNLSASSLSQLIESLKSTIDERNSFLKKSKDDSFSIPTKLLRRRK